MNPHLYSKVEKYIIDACRKSGQEELIPHLKRTVYWAKQLNPETDEALMIAAVAHDCERLFRDKSAPQKQYKSFLDKEKLKIHQDKGARIIGEFLHERGADEELIRRVRMLVSKHEVGGNNDQNLLKDADSLSFFENNIDFFVTKMAARSGKKQVKDKFDWMFDRITSEEARRIAHPWYKEALNKLGY